MADRPRDSADVYLSVEEGMTTNHKELFLNNFCKLNPHWRGAHHVADVLSELDNEDSHLDIVEPMYQRHGREVPEPGLLRACIYACYYTHGGQVSWEAVRNYVRKARPLLRRRILEKEAPKKKSKRP